MLFGDLAAIGSAFTWAIGGVLLRSQTRRVDAVTLNAMQYTVAALFFLGVALLGGRWAGVLEAPPANLAWVVGGSMIGMIAGDTLYVQSLATCGVARAFPITSSLYMLFAYLGAALLLHEPVGWNAALGGAVIASGIALITLPSLRSGSDGAAIAPLGVREWSFLIGTGVFWSVATMCLRVGMTGLDTVTANIVRLPIVALLLVGLSVARQQELRFLHCGWKPIAATLVAGLVGICSGSLMFLYALQTAGAARASILSSLSPLFAAPLSVALFRERLSWMMAAGTVLCVAGTVAITLR